MAKKSKKKNVEVNTAKKKDFGFFLGIVGNILLWAALIGYFVIMPFYLSDGYKSVSTDKFNCYMFISKWAGIIIGGFVVLYFALWGMTREEIKVYKPLWKMDLSVLAFIVLMAVSHAFSDYKAVGTKADGNFYYEGSLWGTSGWYMGLMTMLVAVGMYFAVSRFFKFTKLVFIPIVACGMVQFIWGILNRYGIYPIDMTDASISYLATLGNINWFCGYATIIVPILLGLFWSERRNLFRILYGIGLYISFVMVIVNGSDSGIVALAVTMFALMLFSIKDAKKLVGFSDAMLVFSLSSITVFALDKLYPGVRNYEASLTEVLAKGYIGFGLLMVFLVVRFFASLCVLGKCKLPDGFVKKGARIFLIIAGAGVFLSVLLITVNTLTNGALPLIGKNPLFLFTDDWGSKRGATWKSGWYTFRDISFIKKLIGVGPDCFFFALVRIEDAFNCATASFGSARLTNAHNEILTLLVNNGIFGTLAFVSMVVFSIKASVKELDKKPYFITFILVTVMYLANNVFSFEQITSTPLYIMMLGILGAAVVREYQEG